MEKIKNYIDGALVAPQSGQYLDLYDPASGQVYAHVADSDSSDVDAAVEAAQKAYATCL